MLFVDVDVMREVKFQCVEVGEQETGLKRLAVEAWVSEHRVDGHRDGWKGGVAAELDA